MGNKKFNIKSWADLTIDKRIKKALADLGYTRPMPIQTRAIKAALIDRKHVLGAAKTGSGKTLAFGIPIVSNILAEDRTKSASIRRVVRDSGADKDDFEYAGENLEEIDPATLDDPTICKKLSSDEIDDEIDDDDSMDANDSDEDQQSSDSDQDQITCPEAVVLVPTRELATQVQDEIASITKHTDIKICCLIGGISQEKQLRQLDRLRPEIIVATPGRLYEIAKSELSPHLSLESLASINVLVIDEVDRMTQRGHFEEMAKIIDIVRDSNKLRRDNSLGTCRIYMFSATLTFLHELPERLKSVKTIRQLKKFQDTKHIKPQTKVAKLKGLMKLLGIGPNETKVIDLTDDGLHGRPGQDQLTEIKVNCSIQDKDFYLYHFLLFNQGRTLVFCNSKDCLRRLSNVLKFLKIKTLKLHADLGQKQRLASLDEFRRESHSVMLATDVAARGLDIKNLDHVVHYQVPRTGESYIHRSGRTARIFNKGISLTLCEPGEIGLFRRLCSNILNGKDMDDYTIDTTLKNLIQNRVRLAQQCDRLEHRLRQNKADKSWFIKAAKECEIELDDEDMRQLNKGVDVDVQDEVRVKQERELQKMTGKLNSLLRQPLASRSSRILEQSRMLSV